ncbi:hypothetical protein BU16DRAFT_596013 [Lophium mytilinum]|uniref:Uncharacterized protein n=1 Tax=Lophium mytilinum TaxID=390894 RepID=A0A6A6QHW0_9PEZI|nr:hypothetical protein BU16DRAFT_596013 [Lophium mytilinum]
MLAAFLPTLRIFALLAHAQADIPISPITNVDEAGKTGYFSDPFHVPYETSKVVYISGTTHKYLECDGSLQPKCASSHPNKYDNTRALKQAADDSNTTFCGAAGIHPFQSGSGTSRSWDALVTLHVQSTPDCKGISGWSVIVHAHPENASAVDVPPTSWIGDKVLVGSFSEDVDANYDGKYFQTPAGQLYLVYQKQYSKKPKRDGVVAWPMDNPTTKTPGSKPTFLLLPNDNLNSEDYVEGNDSFKLIETGNMRAINGKFLMAYSYRKVMKNNPDHLWKSQGQKEVFYLLQGDEKHDGWRYVGDQVLAPGVPTVAQIGPNNGWILLFAGYDPKDAPVKDGTKKFQSSHRRPYFIKVDVKVPVDSSVKQASDSELQNWITPSHG